MWGLTPEDVKRLTLWEYGALAAGHARRQRQLEAQQRNANGRPDDFSMDVADDWEPTEEDFRRMRARMAGLGMPDVKV